MAVAEAAAAHDPLLVVAPAVAYGSSGEHDGFAGTLSIGREATELLLVELGRSAAATSPTWCWSAPTAATPRRCPGPLARLAERGSPGHRLVAAWRGDLHAGRTETSLMLAIAPDRVRLGPGRAGRHPARSTSCCPDCGRAGSGRSARTACWATRPAPAADEGRALIGAAAADLAARRSPACRPAAGVHRTEVVT